MSFILIILFGYFCYPVGIKLAEDNNMDQVTKVLEPGRQFSKDSVRLVKRCTKPDRKGKHCDFVSIGCHTDLWNYVICLEFQKIAIATAIGFCIMGFIGFFVKLIHIPINNIIV